MGARKLHPLCLVLNMSLLAASVLVLPTPDLVIPPAAGAVNATTCRPNQVALRLAPGLPSMHTVTLLLEVRNATKHPCDLYGFPSVHLLDSTGHVAATASGSPLQPSTSLSSRTPLELEAGETATAQVVETSPLTTTTCPSYPEVSVGLGTSGTSTVFEHRVSACSSSGLDVTYFVPGFDGTSPSGELEGTAPTCANRARSATSIGPTVTIDAWSGRALAGSTTVFAGSKAPTPYHIVLPPGRYRITSAHTRSRLVTVKLGRVEDLRRFGGCSTITTSTTVPGRTTLTTTTTTTQPSTPAPADRLTKIAFEPLARIRTVHSPDHHGV